MSVEKKNENPDISAHIEKPPNTSLVDAMSDECPESSTKWRIAGKLL